MKNVVLSLVALAGIAAVANAAPVSLTPNAGFGVNGWVAPVAGSTLGTVGNERSFAYNPATGNLIIASRSGGNSLKTYSGTTGAEVGALNLGSGVISGGTFQINQVGVTRDGQIFVGNLSTDTRPTASTLNPIKIYRWASEAASVDSTPWASTTVASPVAALALRMGDSMDVTGSGANARVVMGHGNNAAIGGYTIFQAGGVKNSVTTFSPALTGSRFRLGLTFGANANEVYGKVSSDSLYGTSYVDGNAVGTRTSTAIALTSGGESHMDYANIGGAPILAVLDQNNSTLRVYNLTNPNNPVLLASANATSGTLASNGNGTGAVQFGAIDHANQTATIYAMASNQGISSYTFVVPAPGAAALLALGGLVATRRRR
jgi:hypothetical protein